MASDWRIYAQHAARIVAAGPAPDVRTGRSAFAACTGAPHVDINQAAFFGEAPADEARTLLATITARDLPAVLARSSLAPDSLVAPIAEAGFTRLDAPELLFAMDGVPEAAPAPFALRPIATPGDIAAFLPIAAEIHGYGPGLATRLLGEPARVGEPVSGWLAWDGDVAIASAFVTRVGATLGMWGVMTAGSHQRRGAGGAVVRAALRDAAARSGGPIERTVFWASPQGGPFYRSLGFQPVDELEVWIREVARPEGFEPPTL